MSVSNGENANETTFNGAFMSKDTNNVASGTQDFTNTTDVGAESGGNRPAAVRTAGGIYAKKKIHSLTGLVSEGSLDVSGIATLLGFLQFGYEEDPDTTGTAAELELSAILTVLTNSSLTSISGINAANTNASIWFVKNSTGNPIDILNESLSEATPGRRIETGTDDDLEMKNEAVFMFIYDKIGSRWSLIGGSGSGSGLGDYTKLVSSIDPAATHATLALALADAVSGDKILVKEDQTLVSALTLSVANVEIVFMPNVGLVGDTGLADGLIITGDNARIKGGTHRDFADSNAFAISVQADYVKIFDCHFSNNDDDVEDTIGNGSILGCTSA